MLSRCDEFLFIMMYRFASKAIVSARALGARSFATYFSQDHEWIEVMAMWICELFLVH